MSDNSISKNFRALLEECNGSAIQESLTQITERKTLPVTDVVALHDALLFAIAYAPDNKTYLDCESAIQRLTKLFPAYDEQLRDSGITGSVLVSSFSLELLNWIHLNFPEQVSFHSFDEAKKDIGEDLKMLFPPAEAEAFSWGWSKIKLFRCLCGGKITIEKILQLFRNESKKELANYLFGKSGIYVEVRLSDNLISRSSARSVSYAPFFHQKIQKKFDTAEIISSPLPKAKKLTEKEKEDLVTNARMMLASLGRETDPVTSCNISETEFYCLERGFAITLFYLLPQQRLAFDAYVGYFMYKNGLPVAYGGAWMFFDKALIGINIFDAFRGGESNFLFAQLLRTYSQRFTLNSFSVEPYQYGKNNPEGIQSGAYWFYYRFGFRSNIAELRELAEKEQLKIKTIKNYKTPASILKQFTKSNITLELKPTKTISSATLSLKISESIGKNFGGNRSEAIKRGDKTLKTLFGYPKQKKRPDTVWENWCLAMLILKITKQPNALQKKNFQRMLLSKRSGKESDYLDELNKLKSLFDTN